jgi:hypothetical protein
MMRVLLLLLACLAAAGCAGEPARTAEGPVAGGRGDSVTTGQSGPPRHHSQVPLPTTQRELQAVQHWRVLAASVATGTRSLIEQHPAGLTQRYRMEPAVPSTPFAEAFHALLVTELVKAGIVITPDVAGAVPIRCEIQLLQFGAGRKTGYWVYGTSSTLPPELGIDDPSELSSSGVPRHELLVTTSILREGAYWVRRSDIHYVRDEDAALYRTASLERQRRLIDLVRVREAQRLEAEGWPHYAIPR